jgi:hypothetical protein
VGINFYHCRGNTVTCVSPAPAASQGISNAQGRGGRIEDNTVVGFADNCIDCFGCRDTAIIGNSTRGGKDGVFVGDDPSANITITGNTFTGPQRGVRVQSTMALVNGVVISANTVTAPSDGAVLVNEGGTGQLTAITIVDNQLQVSNAGSYGVKVVNAEVSTIRGNRIWRPRAEGINLDGVDIIDVSNNIVQDAGYAAANTYDAIRVNNAHRVLVRSNIVYGGARYAVAIVSGSSITVTGTRWRSVGTGGVSDGGVQTVLSDNVVF